MARTRHHEHEDGELTNVVIGTKRGFTLQAGQVGSITIDTSGQDGGQGDDVQIWVDGRRVR